MTEALTFVTAAFTLATAVIAWRVQVAVHEVHLSLNSRLDQLVSARGSAERAAGVVEGVAQEKARTDKP